MIYCTHPKTVEAEIKQEKTAQRARVAESRVGHCLANGPLRAQSKENVFSQYSATCRHTSVVGDMSVSIQAHVYVNQGGTADMYVFVLGRLYFSVKGVLFLSGALRTKK